MKTDKLRLQLLELNLTRGATLTFGCETEKEAKKLFHKLKYEQKKLNKLFKTNP